MNILKTRLFLLCASLLLSFVLCESICRIIEIPYKLRNYPLENQLGKYHPTRGWSYVPNLSKEVPVYQNSHSVSYSFDKDGIRIPHKDIRFEYQKESILVIGCSYVMGHALEYESTFCAQLEEMLNGAYQVVNLGVQAYGTDQAYIALKEHIDSFNAKYVIYSFINAHIRRTGNIDRRMFFRSNYAIATKPLFKLNKNKELYLAKKPRPYNQYFHSWFFDALYMGLGEQLGYFPEYPFEVVTELIGEMKKVTEEHGAEFIVFAWETKNESSKVYKYLDKNSLIFSPYSQAELGSDKFVIKGDGHPNRLISEKVARILSERIIKGSKR